MSAILGICSGSLAIFLVLPLSLSAADELQNKVVLPRHQSQPPGPPARPEQAAKKLTVPEGGA